MLAARTKELVEYVSLTDKALDDSMDVGQYMRTFDRVHMPVREGYTPSVFRLKRLSRAHYMRLVASKPDEMPIAMEAYPIVAYGLKGVSGYRGLSGSELVLRFKNQGALDEQVAPQCLDEIAADLAIELAFTIKQMSRIDPLAE